MSREWRLRAGRASDVAAMYALDVVCFEEPFRFDLRTMRRFARRIGATVLVAEAADGLAGFAIVHRERGRLAYLVTLDVAPQLRRLGLAKALMIELERQSREDGAERMGLHVHAENQPAVRLYEELGYQRKAVEADFYGDGLDAAVYVKEL